jgi:hypothetical protein
LSARQDGWSNFKRFGISSRTSARRGRGQLRPAWCSLNQAARLLAAPPDANGKNPVVRPEDIFSMDETGLCFCQPSRTLARGKAGNAKDKKRMTSPSP